MLANTKLSRGLKGMTKREKYTGLEFPCECVSSESGYSDPWAAIAQNKLLPDGTKEEILNLLAEEPKTIAQIAKRLDLSQPSVHRHINEMMASELIRESEEWERKYPAERYYEPNFPVVGAQDGAEFEVVCREVAESVAALFEKGQKRFESAYERTALAEKDWSYADVSHYIYAKVQRHARELLEERGVLPSRKKHRNGAEWVFWAEEPKTDGGE
jgi:DNA-binding transcriptional ArsR family regulator